MRTDDLAEFGIDFHSLPHFYEIVVSSWAEWRFVSAEDVSYFTCSADAWPPVLVLVLSIAALFPFPTCLYSVIVGPVIPVSLFLSLCFLVVFSPPFHFPSHLPPSKEEKRTEKKKKEVQTTIKERGVGDKPPPYPVATHSLSEESL